MKYLVLLMLIEIAYADNNDLFNQAYQAGKQNNFKLNLNNNSTINSYSAANHFESAVANNANTGTVNSRDKYDYVYGGDKVSPDPNYLYKQGAQEIALCQSKTDARCTTLNKYGDKDTQTRLQAYSQGIAQKYSIKVMPDPIDSSCSKIIRKVPINATTATCIASNHNQTKCNGIISIAVAAYECDPTTGACNNYQANHDCIQIRPYIAPTCLTYTFAQNYGNCKVGQASCNVPSTFHTPGCNDSGGRIYSCGSCSTGGDIGDHNGCWHQQCTNWSQAQLASYSCKEYHYSDGCAGFK